MYEFQFCQKSNDKAYRYISQTCTSYTRIMPSVWGEHCIECAAPHCYKTCLRFVARPDAHCARFEYGIEAVCYQERLAAKVKFKPWSKLGCSVCHFFLTAKEYEKIYRTSLFIGKYTAALARFMYGSKLKSKTTGLYDKIIRFLISRAPHKIDAGNIVHLKLGVLNQDRPSSLLVDAKKEDGTIVFRKMIFVPMGESSYCIELSAFQNITWLDLHPADVEESLELTFTETAIVPVAAAESPSGQKVKCVIWDMDNTLWDGVLIEQKEVTPKSELVALIKKLDAMGIVNSIASKNNNEQVMEVLSAHRIADYFVFPKINWEPKSANIAKTIKDMNINPNTVVFVDDNPFEREEVKECIPSITCVDPAEIKALAQGERFNVPVSAESAQRRQTYKMLEALKNEEEQWEGNIDSFLKNCRISLTLSSPTEDSILRCYELLQRSNQLNTSGRRLSMDELNALIHSTQDDCYVLESSDKFGSYGIVGVAIVNHKGTPVLTDFVISCRVANKKIEPTLVNYLACKYNGTLHMNFRATKLNGPMKKMISDLKMLCVTRNQDEELYKHQHDANFPRIVILDDKTSYDYCS